MAKKAAAKRGQATKKRKVSGRRGTAQKKQGGTDLRGVIGVIVTCLGLLSLAGQFIPSSGGFLRACNDLAHGLGGMLCLLLPLVVCWAGVTLVFASARRMSLRTMICGSLIFLFIEALLQLFQVNAINTALIADGVPDGYVNFLVRSYTYATQDWAKGGGLLGALLAWPLYKALDVWGAVVVLIFACAAALLVLTGVSVGGIGATLAEWLYDLRAEQSERKEEREAREEEALERESEKAQARVFKRVERERVRDAKRERQSEEEQEPGEAFPLQGTERAKEERENPPEPPRKAAKKTRESKAKEKTKPVEPRERLRPEQPGTPRAAVRPAPALRPVRNLSETPLYIERDEEFSRDGIDERPEQQSARRRQFTLSEAEAAFLHGATFSGYGETPEEQGAGEQPSPAAAEYTPPARTGAYAMGVPSYLSAARAPGAVTARDEATAPDGPVEPADAYAAAPGADSSGGEYGEYAAEDPAESWPADTPEGAYAAGMETGEGWDAQANSPQAPEIPDTGARGGGQDPRPLANESLTGRSFAAAAGAAGGGTRGGVSQAASAGYGERTGVPSSIPASGVRRAAPARGDGPREEEQSIVQLRGSRMDGTPLVMPKKDEHEMPEAQEAYAHPPIDLLTRTQKTQDVNQRAKDEAGAAKLLETLESFGVQAKLTHVTHGPAITRYEVQPAPGVKVSRIVNLVDDIALNMASDGVRIEAPIPGKPAVGIEIPNEKIETVSLRDVLESPEMQRQTSPTAVALGKGISGAPVIADIAKMPHVLIAGATGSGKSVCINTIINSIIYRASPREVRLILIDPKVVELSVYNGIPHLLVPVVTDPKKASAALSWAVVEMEHRYKRFETMGVREIGGYNKAIGPDEEPMSKIIVIIDELADLMMVAPGEVEESICRLAQLARAAGIHLVIATQRPSVNVITGVIKANIPSRIAFAVSSQIDSRTILDTGGAEKLLGKGDMLYAPQGAGKPTRVQGCFLSDDEVQRVVDFVREKHQADYNEDVMEQMDTAAEEEKAAQGETSGASEPVDEMLQKAIELAIDAGQVSISMLQRRLRVGYARAGRLVDEMTLRGITAEAEGPTKPRAVLITREEWRRMQENGD